MAKLNVDFITLQDTLSGNLNAAKVESLTNYFQQYNTLYYIVYRKACKHNTQNKLVQIEKRGLKTEIYGCAPISKVHETEAYVDKV